MRFTWPTASLLFLSVLTLSSFAFAESTWQAEFHTGSAHQFETTLTIDPDYEFSADYATNAFEGGPYYSVRFSRWAANRAWEIEFLHHKVYLENTPPGIQTFRIANGYNMLLLNHAWNTRFVVVRAGAGPLIAFPISSINGIVTDGGYRLAGIAIQTSLARQIQLSSRWYLSLEGKLTFGHGSVNLNGGFDAKVPNVALHGLAGVGYKF